MKRLVRPLLLASLLLLAGLPLLAGTPAGPWSAAEPTVVFFVRHAEKATGVDPDLTPGGRARAAALASLLQDSGLDQVHSTDYARTRATARPTADQLELEIELYDPRRLQAFVAELRNRGGRHLVVGHSNTTPAAVQLLGGDPGPPIDEATEYNRLYAVTVGENEVSTVLLRFGAPNPDPEERSE